LQIILSGSQLTLVVFTAGGLSAAASMEKAMRDVIMAPVLSEARA
jgi:hypothetical protein